MSDDLADFKEHIILPEDSKQDPGQTVALFVLC